MRVVLDTSVLVAAARSRRGASNALLELLMCLYFTHNIRDFREAEKWGVSAVTPADFLRKIKAKT
jgi:hypothetical protein